MSSKNSSIAALILVVFSTGLASCTLPETSQAQSKCVEQSTSVNCILDTASTGLVNIDDAFAKSSSMAELAVAYSSANNLKKAAELIERARIEANNIEDDKSRVKAISEIAVALSDMKTDKSWVPVLDSLISKNKTRADANMRTDILAKSLTAKAVHGDAASVLDELIKLPQATNLQENSKAIALQKTASTLAKKGNFEAATEAIREITMSISYYQAISRTSVAAHAARADNHELARSLLLEAEPIANEQENGYFGGAIFRDIAFGYAALDDAEQSSKFHKKAKQLARAATKQNEKARAMSRIATKQADRGDTSEANSILMEASQLADQIESNMFLGYSYYEIVGSAAISGEFTLAEKWLDKVPDTPLASTASLKSAAQRDIAWGLARYGKSQKALEVANAIATPREKVQALSRMVRVLNDPKMQALPRYP